MRALHIFNKYSTNKLIGKEMSPGIKWTALVYNTKTNTYSSVGVWIDDVPSDIVKELNKLGYHWNSIKSSFQKIQL